MIDDEIKMDDATLRDFFATCALKAILPVADSVNARGDVRKHANDYTSVAYWMADAMLEARRPRERLAESRAKGGVR